MAQEMGPVEELPVACTLGPGRGEEQLRRWRALEGGHLIHRSRQPDELVVRYRADEASRRELTELIDVEQERCGFVTWTVIDTDDELALVVRGSPADLDALSAGGYLHWHSPIPLRPRPNGRSLYGSGSGGRSGSSVSNGVSRRGVAACLKAYDHSVDVGGQPVLAELGLGLHAADDQLDPNDRA